MVNITSIALPSIIASGMIGSGSIYSITASSGLCLDLKGGSSVDYNPIIAYSCHLEASGNNQKWLFTLVETPNIFKISNVYQPASVLAYPTKATDSTYQGAVARTNSDITWEVTACAGDNEFTLTESINGGALTSWEEGSPLTVQTLSSSSAAQTFKIVTA
ncbi:hypothetical protein CVT26_002582 [Gymnopilus dilepis]|uniref:Ricin B lectin domain-containing protein n=1 Tax=Gymnopilus dilepis TaxID=231916 RepID=A0A409VF32_9AGAR|nr:hypothetical protein CVT26_002582 [Gymnopilus dilepis]